MTWTDFCIEMIPIILMFWGIIGAVVALILLSKEKLSGKVGFWKGLFTILAFGPFIWIICACGAVGCTISDFKDYLDKRTCSVCRPKHRASILEVIDKDGTVIRRGSLSKITVSVESQGKVLKIYLKEK